MRLQIPKPQNSIWIFLIFSVFLFSPSSSEPRWCSEAGRFCGEAKHSESSINFIPNFINAMDILSNQVNLNSWGEYSVISPGPELHAFAQCYSDLSLEECSACFAVSRTKLPRCLPSTSARIYLDGCFLGYDEHVFSHIAVDKNQKSVKCGGSAIDVSKDKHKAEEFGRKVGDVIGNVTEKAAIQGGFSVMGVRESGGVEGVYALAQCWKTVSAKECRRCLRDARDNLRVCLPGAEGRAMFSGCYLRYSTHRFYEAEAESSGLVELWYIVAPIIYGMVLCLFALFGGCMVYKRLSKRKQVNNGQFGISISIRKTSLNFKYEMLEKATDFFNASRKLGQGGAGSVFKGVLPDGRTVAVKRLFFNTRQWVDDFFNEVNLISGMEHKNLVRLLGCSIEGPESLLVYEYVHKSLDQILFGKDKVHTLSWQQRFDIIFGIAEGLVHLHESSGVKIIHRDIKSSNILLDERLVPKIADFGLARCVGPDQSHLSTGIAGTLGYMAPEYLVRGQLTDKADVYAFGVLVLEIVCGRKNRVFAEGSKSSVLYTVWKNYKAKNITESVDPILKGTFPERQASDVLRMGLLCTQASLAVRPSMSQVVLMLTDKECVIPLPKQPPFLNASILASDASRPSMTSLSQTTDGVSLKSTTMVTAESHFSATIEASEPR